MNNYNSFRLREMLKNSDAQGLKDYFVEHYKDIPCTVAVLINNKVYVDHFHDYYDYYIYTTHLGPWFPRAEMAIDYVGEDGFSFQNGKKNGLWFFKGETREKLVPFKMTWEYMFSGLYDVVKSETRKAS